MEIVTLVENTSEDVRLQAEFGLSILIKSESCKILFDMGASSKFAQNAEILEEDLASVDCGVISHAHYDHGGGLATFLRINNKAKVYVGSTADGKYYGNVGAELPLFLLPFVYPMVKNSRLFSRYVGLDSSILRKTKDRIIFVDGQRQILDNVFLLSSISETFPLAEGNKFILEEKDNRLQRDNFEHEMIMVIRESDGLVLFTGCGHRGIRNMVKTVQDHFKGEYIKAVVGGFHLALQPGKPGIAGKDRDIVALGKEFVNIGVKKVITGHCTGDDACALIKSQIGKRLNIFSTGKRYTI